MTLTSYSALALCPASSHISLPTAHLAPATVVLLILRLTKGFPTSGPLHLPSLLLGLLFPIQILASGRPAPTLLSTVCTPCFPPTQHPDCILGKIISCKSGVGFHDDFCLFLPDHELCKGEDQPVFFTAVFPTMTHDAGHRSYSLTICLLTKTNFPCAQHLGQHPVGEDTSRRGAFASLFCK